MAFEIAPPKRDLPRASARRNDRDAIWRLCGWGGAALTSVLALIAATQSDTGGERLAQMLSPSMPAVAAAAPRPPEKDPDTLRLQADLRWLAADRERLVARLAKLEHHLEEVTGSIQRQAAAAAAPPPPVATPAPPPQIAPSQSIPAAEPEPPAAARTAAPAPAPAVTVPLFDPLAMPGVANSPGWIVGPPQTDEPMRAQSFETRDVPLPPTRLAALPAQEPANEQPRPASPKSEYGIDLGTASDMDALRERWAGIKANLGPMLTGLQPIAVRDRRPGSTGVHLVVGPMPNLAAARQVCSRFAAARVTCQPTKFDADAVVQR